MQSHVEIIMPRADDYEQAIDQAFNQALVDRRTTVSRVIAGRQSLSPASQIPEVDAPWREHFIHHVLNPATAGSFNPPFLQRNPSGGRITTPPWHIAMASGGGVRSINFSRSPSPQGGHSSTPNKR